MEKIDLDLELTKGLLENKEFEITDGLDNYTTNEWLSKICLSNAFWTANYIVSQYQNATSSLIKHLNDINNISESAPPKLPNISVVNIGTNASNIEEQLNSNIEEEKVNYITKYDNGNVENVEKTTYDSEGRKSVITNEHYREDGTLASRIVQVYDYDKKTVTRKATYYENDGFTIKKENEKEKSFYSSLQEFEAIQNANESTDANTDLKITHEYLNANTTKDIYERSDGTIAINVTQNLDPNNSNSKHQINEYLSSDGKTVERSVEFNVNGNSIDMTETINEQNGKVFNEYSFDSDGRTIHVVSTKLDNNGESSIPRSYDLTYDGSDSSSKWTLVSYYNENNSRWENKIAPKELNDPSFMLNSFENSPTDSVDISYGIGTVNTESSGLNVRSGMGMDSRILGTAPKNSSLEILEPDNNGWTKVRDENGVEGYVSSKYISINNEE